MTDANKDIEKTPIGKTPVGEAPSYREAAMVWWRIGVLSFGGPAAQIALMHRMVVDERKWLSEQQFLNALSFCMMLPGPEAMQLATYAGWRLHGVAGGLMAGLAFVLPGAAVILCLAAAYALYGQAPLAASLFMGIKAAVLVIVLEALLKVARKALSGPAHWLIAAFAFVGIFFLEWPFPLIIAFAALYGLRHGRGLAQNGEQTAEPQGTPDKVTFIKTLTTVLVWLVIWWLPVALVWALASPDAFGTIGLFFSKLAMVTFGGAYAVLAYMAQDAVDLYGWLSATEMMDGLGLAETTPGPLILVTEFVGFLAAARVEGGVNLWLGLAGAMLTLWATFAPCFLWVFAGAPYIEWISARPQLREALRAITAAVVGVILNLSVWFALHVLFDTVEKQQVGLLSLHVPNWQSFNPEVFVLSLLAGYMLHVRQWSIVKCLAVTSGLGLLIGLLGV
ncbi:chromate transporter [Cohaesibacter sp. ES.047]|uniref:chromate efflux transporter n=1 Tax=Cohaesibacter sp. ES.047 TaxID=1798205 RepID=UPI000BB8D661|nr:chromate efflux transporter [Cohaesibacter sp. ES.047]SNY91783.1 chromate transporter [Cohaesibacter sp. ES.047]